MRFVSLLLAALVACSGGDEASTDATSSLSGDARLDSPDGRTSDAAISGCTVTPDAFLGRCKLEGGDADCWGIPGESRVFVPLTPGESVRAVNGPQGSLMIVLAARTSGIYPGDPKDPASPDNAIVDIMLFNDMNEEFARYRGRPLFEPSSQDPAELDAPGLFVIVEGINSGTPVTAVLEIEDRDGKWRCGTIDFIATR